MIHIAFMKPAVLKVIMLIVVIMGLFPLLLQAGQLQTVSLQLQWKHQFEYAGFYAAIEKGFYRDEGLQVELREIRANNDPVADVLQGRADFGITYSSLITDYLAGKPVVMLANIFKNSALVIIAQKEFYLPSDLKGKRIMGSEVELRNSGLTMMFNRFDLVADDFAMITPEHSIDAFAEKRIDAMTAFITNQPYLLNLKNIKYTIQNPTSYGSQFYDVNLFTSLDEANKHPKRVAAFRRASIKGWKYALTHSDEIIELILAKYNSQQKTKNALKYEAEIIKSLVLPRIYHVGSIDCKILNEMAENFIRQSMAPENSDLSFRDFLFEQNCAPLNDSGFSPEEQQYLQDKEKIKVCIDPDWMPFEQIKNGQYIGMSADYLQFIGSVIQTPIELLVTEDWQQSINYVKSRKCDILSLVMATPERKKYLNFTQAYLTIPLVIATTTDKLFIADLNDVADKKLGLVKNYAFTELLKLDYPDIDFVEVDSVQQGLEQLEQKKLFAMIDNLSSLAYQIQKKYAGTLKISGRINKNWSLGIGVRNDDLLLLSILEKAINQINEKLKQKILNQWTSITYEQETDYSFLWKLLAAILVIFLLMIYRYKMVTAYNHELQQLNTKLEKLTITDTLTQLYNRRYLDLNNQHAINLAKRYKTPFALVLLDIDNFKQVNDNYGHLRGDKTLNRVAFILSSQSRKNDIVGRWGGEEFLIICAQSSLQGAHTMAENLRLAIAQEKFIAEQTVTISIGVTEYQKNDTPEIIINRVDQALYKAKSRGKNQVVSL